MVEALWEGRDIMTAHTTEIDMNLLLHKNRNKAQILYLNITTFVFYKNQ